MKGYNPERCIVRLIKQAVDGRGWSQREFASRAMPERTRSAACSAWQSTYAYSRLRETPYRSNPTICHPILCFLQKNNIKVFCKLKEKPVDLGMKIP
jgi:hypothetical protein